jgi:hypothetical protein
MDETGRQLAWELLRRHEICIFARIIGIGTGSPAHSDRVDIIKSFDSSCAMLLKRSLALLLT